jgi:hypothetical protein
MNKGPLANINFKTVVKAKDMDDDMFNQLEKWARETFESKEKFRDEMVYKILILRKLLTT